MSSKRGWVALILFVLVLKAALAHNLFYIDHDKASLNSCKGKHKKSISAAVISTSSSPTTSYNITFDLNCTADATECAGVRATFEKATEIISSVFQFKSSLLINASYNPFCSFSKDCSNEDSMAAIGQAYPTISYIMIDNTDNMTRMYPQALLKQYTKLSVQPAWAYYDINAQFNSQVNWYFVVSFCVYIKSFFLLFYDNNSFV